MTASRNRIDFIIIVIVVLLFFYSSILLMNAFFNGENIGEWIWDRHQNLFSWYSRPLFIIPACYYAYKQKLGLIIAFMLLLGTSLFWFAPPTDVPEHISAYLEWESNTFFNPENKSPLILLIITVSVFLFLLFYAFWKRSFLIGLIVLNIGNVIKIIVSIGLGGQEGKAAILPTLTSILTLNFIAFLIWKIRKNKLKKRQ